MLNASDDISLILHSVCAVCGASLAHVCVLLLVLQAGLQMADVIRIRSDQFVRPLNIVRYNYQYSPIVTDTDEEQEGKEE